MAMPYNIEANSIFDAFTEARNESTGAMHTGK